MSLQRLKTSKAVPGQCTHYDQAEMHISYRHNQRCGGQQPKTLSSVNAHAHDDNSKPKHKGNIRRIEIDRPKQAYRLPEQADGVTAQSASAITKKAGSEIRK
jgi:hypothetical protein